MVKNKKFETEGYHLSITSKNITITAAIEKYVLEKIAKLDPFADHILDIKVTLDVQKVAHIVAMRMKYLHFMLRVQSRTEDLYSAIDQASDRLIKLMQKYRTKLISHRAKPPLGKGVEIQVLKPISYVEEINEQIDEENLKKGEELYKVHEIVNTKSLAIKMLTQGEAAVKLELSKDNFLIYKSEEDQRLKVMYKRNDKKLGLIHLEAK